MCWKVRTTKHIKNRIDGATLVDGTKAIESEEVRREIVATSGLHEEGEYVSAYEDLGQPVYADWRQGFGLGEAHETTKDHVDRGSEKSWRDKEQYDLDDVDTETLLVFACYRAEDIA